MTLSTVIMEALVNLDLQTKDISVCVHLVLRSRAANKVRDTSEQRDLKYFNQL